MADWAGGKTLLSDVPNSQPLVSPPQHYSDCLHGQWNKSEASMTSALYFILAVLDAEGLELLCNSPALVVYSVAGAGSAATKPAYVCMYVNHGERHRTATAAFVACNCMMASHAGTFVFGGLATLPKSNSRRRPCCSAVARTTLVYVACRLFVRASYTPCSSSVWRFFWMARQTRPSLRRITRSSSPPTPRRTRSTSLPRPLLLVAQRTSPSLSRGVCDHFLAIVYVD